MLDNTGTQTADILRIAGKVACAYVSNNSVPTVELPFLFQGVHAALARLANRTVRAVTEDTHEKLSVARIRRSVTPDGIVSFLDGKTYKTMKRHLRTHGLDPHGYRQRYGLPADYPMVAPNYAAMRSALAKSIGLGRIADYSKKSKSKAKRHGKVA